jgi:hypothetical protein
MASLARSNKHLSTRAKREKAVQLTVATSSAIEGIRAPFKGAKTANKGNASKAPVKSPKRAPSA